MVNFPLPVGLLLAALVLSPATQAADARPGKGLAEIPDPELNLMRGRYTVGNNAVAWFGVSMVSQWQAANGTVIEGALTLGMDFRGSAVPRISFVPSVRVTAADAALPATGPATRSIDSAGLANVAGLVQSVQVAGDGNRARNSTALLIRDGDVPAVATTSSQTVTAVAGDAMASASFDGNQARLQLQIDGVGQVQQWIRSGSVGQMIALAGDGQQADNRLQIELVRQSLASTTPLSQNVAQAIALGRGIGAGR